MKELSIEEKAKRYDKALEAIKSLQEVNPSDEGIQNWVNENFPELKESEDDRILKHLKAVVKAYDMWAERGLDMNDILAWLEKKGAQVNFINKIQVGDEVTRNKDGVLVNLTQLKRVANKGIEKAINEKQGEQKAQGKSTLEGIANKVESRQEELTEFERAVKQVMEEAIECGDTRNLKADADMLLSLVHNSSWSEEDEEMLNSFLHKLEVCDLLSIKECIWIKNKLKALKNRVQPQPKQEWSVEDRSKIQIICKYLNEVKKYCADITEVRECIDWLKALIPQNSWKPSDEQMNTLEHYMHTLVCTKYKEILFGLYTDLKKLRGE